MSWKYYTQKTAEELFSQLKSSPQGLLEKEALLRQKKYGFNEITLGNVTVFTIIMRQVKSPFFYLIVLAGLISWIAGEVIDAMVIFATMLINVGIGFFQEYRAENAVKLLRKFISEKAKLIRPGSQKSKKKEIELLVDRRLLVPGDVIVLEAGDVVPADARIFESEGLLVDETVLTGESVPVDKFSKAIPHGVKELFDAKNMLFAGCSVIGGRARALVVSTGKETAFGQIANLVVSARRASTYEKSILYFCQLVLRIVVITMVLMFAANLFLKGFGDFFNLILFSVALIVSILPEALPAVVTFALAKGSLVMAKKHVVVRRLSAIEDLGNIEMLCTDKTGTLTENKLFLEEVVSSNKEKCLLLGAVHDGKNVEGKKMLNPFDVAIAKKAGKALMKKAEAMVVISEAPFDSFRMMASLLAEDGEGNGIIITKGAPEMVLEKCSEIGEGFDRKSLHSVFESQSMEGKRVLAIAYKDFESKKITPADEKNLTFLGYFIFEDPLKSTAKEAIALSKKLGVAVKIITGDSSGVAAYIGKKVGLIDDTKNVVTGEQLANMSKKEFERVCHSFFVFARISPEQKYDIIKTLQEKHEVGFLGEGINDAPALKLANVAIAVPSASDISREVSDVVMLQQDLRVIVEGIREGRTIFANINKYIKCTLSANFGNFYSVAVISLFISYLPMLPVQILLGNLLSDFPLISVGTDTVDVEELRKPKLYQLHMVLPLIIVLALVSTVFDFIFFTMFYHQTPGIIQTMWFVMSVLTELGLIFIIRTRHVFWKTKRPTFLLLSLMVVSAITVIILPFLTIGQKLFHFEAPQVSHLLLIFVLTGFYFVVTEIVKLIYFQYFKPPKPRLADN